MQMFGRSSERCETSRRAKLGSRVIWFVVPARMDECLLRREFWLSRLLKPSCGRSRPEHCQILHAGSRGRARAVNLISCAAARCPTLHLSCISLFCGLAHSMDRCIGAWVVSCARSRSSATLDWLSNRPLACGCFQHQGGAELPSTAQQVLMY